MTVAPALVAVLTTARMTAFRPGASPPPVRTPIFRMVGMRREVGWATARIADVTAGPAPAYAAYEEGGHGLSALGRDVSVTGADAASHGATSRHGTHGRSGVRRAAVRLLEADRRCACGAPRGAL